MDNAAAGQLKVPDAGRETGTATPTLWGRSGSAGRQRDPELRAVAEFLMDQSRLEEGCIVLNQYRDSVTWLAEQLTELLPTEWIAL